jgi:hypothetical protein
MHAQVNSFAPCMRKRVCVCVFARGSAGERVRDMPANMHTRVWD